jgi:high-affinity K+ transport system ATPase subunit B
VRLGEARNRGSRAPPELLTNLLSAVSVIFVRAVVTMLSVAVFSKDRMLIAANATVLNKDGRAGIA